MFASGVTVNETPAMVMYAVAALFLALSFVILLGKGDFLISGYNTASEEEKAKYGREYRCISVARNVAWNK